MPCRIEIAALSLYARIGCTEEERARPQTILVQASVSSGKGFEACETDALEGTIDASRIQRILTNGIEESRVKTLERLGRLLELALRREFTASGLDWEIRLSKPRFGWAYVHAWRS